MLRTSSNHKPCHLAPAESLLDPLANMTSDLLIRACSPAPSPHGREQWGSCAGSTNPKPHFNPLDLRGAARGLGLPAKKGEQGGATGRGTWFGGAKAEEWRGLRLLALSAAAAF